MKIYYCIFIYKILIFTIIYIYYYYYYIIFMLYADELFPPEQIGYLIAALSLTFAYSEITKESDV